jgi:hypothetical protein
MTIIAAIVVLYALGALIWLCVPPRLPECHHKPGKLKEWCHVNDSEYVGEEE